MALTGALCQTLLAATGFTNKNLRVLIAGLLGSDYRPGQMTYDLRRLRLAGLIHRLPHSNRYTLDRHVDDYITRARHKCEEATDQRSLNRHHLFGPAPELACGAGR
jgi:hypothetical protein